MPRHLTSDQIISAINRGKSVEQLLQRPAPDQLAWIELRPVSGGVELWRYEVFDDGSEEFLDVYSFSPIEEWPETPVETYSRKVCLFTKSLPVPLKIKGFVHPGCSLFLIGNILVY